MKNKLVKKLLAGTLVLVMVANMTACGKSASSGDGTKAGQENSTEISTESTETEAEQQEMLTQAITAAVGSGSTDGIEKEETVYVFTDASGNPQNITVSNWLKNEDNLSAIEDNTTLSDIKNVEGDASYNANGDELTWTAEDGGDVYYQGETTKKPPVKAKFTYYLNGQEVQPDQLAGKEGEVKIHIEYENTEKYEDVYVPFTAVTGIVFDNEHVKNVKIDNGSVISEGKNTVVVGMGFPGLQESLQSTKNAAESNLKKIASELEDKDAKQTVEDLNTDLVDFDIPSSCDITMDAKDFKMGMCMTMVFSNLLADDGDDKNTDDFFDSLDKGVDKLKESGNKLADGATQLSDGIKKANDNMPDLKDGTKQLADGVKEYTDGVSKVNDGAHELKSGAATAKDGANQLNTGAKTLATGTSLDSTEISALRLGVQSLASGTAELHDEVQKYVNNTDGALDEAGQAAKEGLLANDDYKAKKQELIDKVNTLPKEVDGIRDYIDSIYTVAFKKSMGLALTGDESKTYNENKNNEMYQAIEAGIEASKEDITAAATNA
ncbi:MAG: hypothetical protein IKG19_01615, partial [Lachnospiraceae bacterium]|nr:hypothetical protein [Lachnospiraceae bacterium]